MEGPSLLIIKDELRFLKGKIIQAAEGTANIDYSFLEGKRVKKILSFGKHFLIVFPRVTIRIHFLMFGSYRVNEQRDRPAKLTLRTGTGEVNFYSCAVSFLDEEPDAIYDWTADVMSDTWSSGKARNKLKKTPSLAIGDALLDQNIFAGVGNIIRNEVLFRVLVHPDSVIGAIPPMKLTQIINESRNYSFDFLRWKKEFALKKNWVIYKKKKCRRCDGPVQKQYTGTTKRRCFICTNCQVLFN
jgi:endonuclease-8